MVVALGLPINGVRPAKTWLAVDSHLFPLASWQILVKSHTNPCTQRHVLGPKLVILGPQKLLGQA
jgi:hypothetical protein